MNKKISVGMAVSLMAIAATIAVMLTYSLALNKFEARMSAITDRTATYDLINEVDNTIRQKYYADIVDDDLRYSIASGLIEGLGDEDCRYYTETEWELEQDRAAGYDFGLGMDVTRTSEGAMRVTRVQPTSPASKGGIRTGDIVLKVGGDAVADIGYDKARDNIAAIASEVSLSIERDGKALENAIVLTKERYNIATAEYRALEEKIGEIIVYGFNALTPEQFNAALTRLQKDSVKGIIIDLRESSGGSYEAAADILDTLVGSGRLMIVTDKKGEQTVRYKSDNSAIDMLYTVLVGDQTEGAAELFTSALYDFTECDVVGEQTAGQRTFLEDFPLSDGSAIRLSTGVWTTPGGKLLDENGGVVPNFQTKLTSYQRNNLRLLTLEEDPQMQTALSRMRSRIEILEENEASRNGRDSVSGTDTPVSETDGAEEKSETSSDNSSEDEENKEDKEESE